MCWNPAPSLHPHRGSGSTGYPLTRVVKTSESVPEFAELPQGLWGRALRSHFSLSCDRVCRQSRGTESQVFRLCCASPPCSGPLCPYLSHWNNEISMHITCAKRCKISMSCYPTGLFLLRWLRATFQMTSHSGCGYGLSQADFQVSPYTEGASQPEAETWQPSSQNQGHLGAYVSNELPTFKNQFLQENNWISGIFWKIRRSGKPGPSFPNGCSWGAAALLESTCASPITAIPTGLASSIKSPAWTFELATPPWNRICISEKGRRPL